MKKYKQRLLLSCLVTLAALVLPTTVIAQQDQTGSGLSISPTRTDLSINPGNDAELKISVKNVTGGEIISKAFINDFEPDGVTGEPRLITDPNVKSAYSIKDFIVGLEDFNLGIDETREVAMQVAIPSNAAPGAYYGVIRYQAIPVGQQQAPGGGQVALTASVGSIVLIEVPGNVKQQAEIRDLSAYLDDKKGSFFTKKPNGVGVEIANLGNGFARPFGKINITDMFGNQKYEYELNNVTPQGVVLPDSTRTFKDSIEGISLPGRYTIQANVSYSNGGEAYVVNSTFWYVPVWLLGVILLLVIVIIAGAYYVYRKFVTKSTRRKR